MSEPTPEGRRLADDLTSLREIHAICCINERPPTDRRGCCASKDSLNLAEHLRRRAMSSEVAQRLHVHLAGCLDVCKHGPAMLILPDGVWYHYEAEADVEEILERHLVRGERVQRLLIVAQAPP